MKKILLFSLLFILSLNNVNASTNTAHEYILMESTTGRVIKGRNYNTPMLIASITNIMTTCVWTRNSLEIKNVSL